MKRAIRLKFYTCSGESFVIYLSSNLYTKFSDHMLDDDLKSLSFSRGEKVVVVNMRDISRIEIQGKTWIHPLVTNYFY
jgi:nitrate reductase alpha subunit